MTTLPFLLHDDGAIDDICAGFSKRMTAKERAAALRAEAERLRRLLRHDVIVRAPPRAVGFLAR